jgi:hypothetical protein
MIEYVQACRAKISSSYESLCSTSEQVVSDLKSLVEKRENYALILSDIAHKQGLSSALLIKVGNTANTVEAFDTFEAEQISKLQGDATEIERLYEECQLQLKQGTALAIQNLRIRSGHDGN